MEIYIVIYRYTGPHVLLMLQWKQNVFNFTIVGRFQYDVKFENQHEMGMLRQSKISKEKKCKSILYWKPRFATLQNCAKHYMSYMYMQVYLQLHVAPKLLCMIQSFHLNMKGVVQFDGSSSYSFATRSGAKQGCVLAPTLTAPLCWNMLWSVYRGHLP